MHSLEQLNSYSNIGLIFSDERIMSITFSNNPASNVSVTGTNSNLNMSVSSVGTNITSLLSANNVSYSVNLSSFSGATLSWALPLPNITSSSTNGNVYTISNIIDVSDWQSIRYPNIHYPTPLNSINFGNNYSITSNITYANTAISWTTHGIIEGPTYKYVKNNNTTLWYGADTPTIIASDGAAYSYQLTLGANVGYIASGAVSSPPTNWSYGNLTYSYSGTSTQCTSDLSNLRLYPHTDISSTTTLQYRQQRNAIETINNAVSFVGSVGYAPGTPIIGLAVTGNAQASIGFIPPSSDGGAPIINYTMTSTPSGITATGTSSPIVVAGLTNGTSYTFKVKATNVVGDSSYSSDSNSIIVGVPGIPGIGIATRGNTTANVAFTAPANNGDIISNYIVTSTPSGITATGATSPITITGLTNGTSYTFKVKATNSRGTGADSAESNAIIPATVPGAPTSLSAITSGTSANISFTAPNNGGDTITGYTMTSTPGNLTATGSSTSLTVNGLTMGTSYTFKAKATNSVGTGSESAASNSIIVGAPGSPTIGRASLMDTTIAQIKFTAPSNSGNSAITSYTVTSYPGGLTTTGVSSPLTVSGLTLGTSYTFKVKATNSIGTGLESANSNSITSGTVLAIQHLMVGAGGAGGNGFGTTANGVAGSGGGGGGGGIVVANSFSSNITNSYRISIGTGGIHGSSTGSDSSLRDSQWIYDGTLLNLVAYGSMGGGYAGFRGGNGGTLRNGGGAGGSNGGTGFSGGTGVHTGGNSTGGSTGYQGGGGGGGAGANGTSSSSSNGGTGGAGIYSSITGANVAYGIGGKGGSTSDWNGADGTNFGEGGSGGGGFSTPGTGTNGGSGASGIIVIKYPDTYLANVGLGLTATTINSGGYNITSFTSGIGTITFE